MDAEKGKTPSPRWRKKSIPEGVIQLYVQIKD
jgi:hypothetical protein